MNKNMINHQINVEVMKHIALCTGNGWHDELEKLMNDNVITNKSQP